MKINFNSENGTVSLSEIDIGSCFSRLVFIGVNKDNLYMRICREYNACDPNEECKKTKLMAINLAKGYLLEIDKNEEVIPKPNAIITFS